MTPKEKAEELINNFKEYTKVFDDCSGWVDDVISAKQCALIAVDEIIDEVYRWAGGDNTEWDIERFEYLKKVKQEIEAL